MYMDMEQWLQIRQRVLLKARLGRRPTAKETAAELKMDMTEFKRLKRNANVASMLSLDTKYTDTENDEGVSIASPRP